jgi:hypothetical protein
LTGSDVAADDQYICPERQTLQLVRTDMKRNQKSYRIVKRGTCRKCRHWGECTTAIQGRVIKRSTGEEVIEKVRENFKTERAQQLFALRKIRAEHPFAHIKENLGYRRMLVRGKIKVQGELALMSLAYNVRKMWGILGIKPLIQAMG